MTGNILNGMVFSVSHLVGLSPGTSKGDLSWRAYARSVVASLLILLVTGYTIFSGTLQVPGVDDGPQIEFLELTIKMVHLTLLAVVGLTSAGIAVTNHLHVRKGLGLLRSLKPTRSLYWHSATSLFMFLFVSSYNSYRRATSIDKAAYILSIYMPLFVIIMIESQFTFLLELVKDRYESAMNSLHNIKSTHQLEIILAKVRGFDNACKHFNKAYSLALLEIFAVFFTTMISEMYDFSLGFLSFLESKNSRESLKSLASFLGMIILLIHEIWKIGLAGTTTKRQISKFNEQLYRLSLIDEQNNFCGNASVKSHLLKNNDVSITAYNFFNIELPIVQSILGATATYLVIMLQLHWPSH